MNSDRFQRLFGLRPTCMRCNHFFYSVGVPGIRSASFSWRVCDDVPLQHANAMEMQDARDFGVRQREVRMAYYKVRIEVWCDWHPAESDLDDIAQGMGVGEAICTMREVVASVERPQDIEDEDAMTFFGGQKAMPTRVRGRSCDCCAAHH